MRVLIVDDEKNIREVLKMNLEMRGFEVVTLSDGRAVKDMLNEQYFDIILLDVMMPYLSGLEVMDQINLSEITIPIIFISAKDLPEDRIVGLRKGADDYITKPFNLDELVLRMNNIIKRNDYSPAIHNIYRFGQNWIDFSKYTAMGSNGDIILTKKEVMLLKLLIENKEEVVSRQKILQLVWGYDVFPSTRTIDNFILAFRKYFEQDPKRPKYFISIRSIGYKFSNL